jgi:hypothetical protein
LTCDGVLVIHQFTVLQVRLVEEDARVPDE